MVQRLAQGKKALDTTFLYNCPHNDPHSVHNILLGSCHYNLQNNIVLTAMVEGLAQGMVQRLAQGKKALDTTFLYKCPHNDPHSVHNILLGSCHYSLQNNIV